MNENTVDNRAAHRTTLVFVLWPGETVYEMVGLRRIEQTKPEQHDQQHSDRPEQVGEISSHVGNIHFDGMTWRFNNRKNQYLFRDTLMRLLASDNLEYKELTKAA